MRTHSSSAIVKLSCILLAAPVGAWPQAVFGQGSTHEQDEIQLVALENAWNQAELHNDPAALKLLLADDLTLPNPTEN
jgi:hypothetical protein